MFFVAKFVPVNHVSSQGNGNKIRKKTLLNIRTGKLHPFAKASKRNLLRVFVHFISLAFSIFIKFDLLISVPSLDIFIRGALQNCYLQTKAYKIRSILQRGICVRLTSLFCPKLKQNHFGSFDYVTFWANFFALKWTAHAAASTGTSSPKKGCKGKSGLRCSLRTEPNYAS